MVIKTEEEIEHEVELLCDATMCSSFDYGYYCGLMWALNKYDEKRKHIACKGDTFIKHILNHIEDEPYYFDEPRPKVVCKICNKTVDEIYKAERGQ